MCGSVGVDPPSTVVHDYSWSEPFLFVVWIVYLDGKCPGSAILNLHVTNADFDWALKRLTLRFAIDFASLFPVPSSHQGNIRLISRDMVPFSVQSR